MSYTRDEVYITNVEEDENGSEAVLRAIAAVSNRPILDLPSLPDSIDPDSLDRLFTSAPPPDSVEFGYGKYEVTVVPDRVRIHKQ